MIGLQTAALFDRFGLDIRPIADTEVADEADKILAGEAFAETEIAGLQYYDYGVTGLDGEPVIPRDGDRLTLIREPSNRYDPNAVEVWWRNGVRLGHLPRAVAAKVAAFLDAGVPLRAYIANGGNGEAWSARALLVGEPVRPLHEQRIQHVIQDAIREHESREWRSESRHRELGRVNGLRFHEEESERRKRRLVQAVNALLPGEPFSIEVPVDGACIELCTIEKLLDVSRSTARRIAERAGCRCEVHRRGWYATGTHVVVTRRLQQALLDWAAHPVRRITHEDVDLGRDSIVAPKPSRDDPDGIPF